MKNGVLSTGKVLQKVNKIIQRSPCFRRFLRAFVISDFSVVSAVVSAFVVLDVVVVVFVSVVVSVMNRKNTAALPSTAGSA